MIGDERVVLECLVQIKSRDEDQAMTTLAMMPGMIMTEAMRKARGAVKEELKRHRVRLADVDAKDITSWAMVYIEDHPELIAEAKLAVSEWFARGVFGKRAAKAFKEELKIEQTQVEGSVANG